MDGKDLAQLGFFSGTNLLSGRISGFTEEEKGVVAHFATEFINNGKFPISISFGAGKEVCCPAVALRASEITEDYGLVGVYIVHHILWGRNNPISHQDALSAYFALKSYYKQFMERMKGGE